MDDPGGFGLVGCAACVFGINRCNEPEQPNKSPFDPQTTMIHFLHNARWAWMLSNRLGRSQFLTRFGTPDTDVSSQMTDAHLVDHWVFSLHHYFCYDVHLIPVRVFQRVFDLCKNHYTNLYIIWCPRPFGALGHLVWIYGSRAELTPQPMRPVPHGSHLSSLLL